MATEIINPFEIGSQWRRWNPHIHAPGTLLNDQFKKIRDGDQFRADWDSYLRAINDAVPIVEAIGVTDYLCLEGYKAVVEQQRAGKLPKVRFLFPNVELRLSIETEKRKGVNLHLLFNPADDNHVDHIERAMLELTFEYQGSPYRCSPEEFGRLGRAHNSVIVDELVARSEGANQFKVSLDQLRKMFRNNTWVAENCIVAVAASNNDGTAGLQKDASFAATRKEIEAFADVIFASNPNTRDFWLGKHPDHDVDNLKANYGGRKPCLHGCDAHSVEKVCKPVEKRYCWIKGDPSFESLRQTLLEPEERVWIGESAPNRHDASQCIARVSTKNTPWLGNGEIPMNAGLVAIIGSRGSGKTALADIVASGADVDSPLNLATSFIHRATTPVNYLDESEVHLYWGDGNHQPRWINKQIPDQPGESVRYLSQQFVEQLCSAAGLAVELRKEIERVVFDATETEDRFATHAFEELADVHLKPILRERDVAQTAIASISDQVNAEEALTASIPAIEKAQADRLIRIKKARKDMKGLIPKDRKARAERLAVLEAAFTKLNTQIELLNRAQRRVADLQREVDSVRNTTAPQQLDQLKTSFTETALTEEQWDVFSLVFKGNVDQVIADRSAAIAAKIKVLTEGTGGVVDVDSAPIETWPHEILKAERENVRKEVGLDGQKQLRYTQLQKQLEADEKAQQKSVEELANAKGATDRKVGLLERRRKLYTDVFQSFLDEQKVLEQLYAPLQKTLENSTGSLERLRLAVSREIDLDAWIKMGEDLLDLRKESQLRGHGALERHVRSDLVPAWRIGTAEVVGEAMQKFIANMHGEIMKSVPATVTPENKAVWIQKVATWLYNTDHIKMVYNVTYDGVAIEQLSPGTRGIVLLLLYLVIDAKDTRPLIIDQPEENLDPKSVFDELVPHFREARKRRQVIIVTHNANLVVNTDADQVIIASSEPNPSGGLPNVTYRCGSIENSVIRGSVCDILEGGEEAFRDRERRYRIQRDAVTQ